MTLIITDWTRMHLAGLTYQKPSNIFNLVLKDQSIENIPSHFPKMMPSLNITIELMIIMTFPTQMIFYRKVINRNYSE